MGSWVCWPAILYAGMPAYLKLEVQLPDTFLTGLFTHSSSLGSLTRNVDLCLRAQNLPRALCQDRLTPRQLLQFKSIGYSLAVWLQGYLKTERKARMESLLSALAVFSPSFVLHHRLTCCCCAIVAFSSATRASSAFELSFPTSIVGISEVGATTLPLKLPSTCRIRGSEG